MFNFFGKKKVQANQRPASFSAVVNPARAEGLNDRIRQDRDSLAKEGFLTNIITYACIRRIATDCASLKLELFQGDKYIENHDLLKLLKKPSPMYSGSQFIEVLLTDKLIYGSAFITRVPESNITSTVRPPSELSLLKPSDMKVDYGKFSMPIRYIHVVNGIEKQYPVDSLTGYSDVRQLKFFNPIGDASGLSPIEPAGYSIDTFNEAQIWNRNLLLNDAKPSGTLSTEENMTDEDYMRLKQDLEELRSGSGNAGKPWLLTNGLKWQAISMTAREMDYGDNLLMSARFIASAFGVPPMLINIPGESTYSNYAHAKETFWIDTIIPHVQSVLDDLNSWLCPMFGDGLELRINKDQIDALEEKRLTKFERIKNADFLTINEKREIVGYDSVDEGDKILVNSSQVPVEALDDMYLKEFNNAKELQAALEAKGVSKAVSKKYAELTFPDA